MKSGPIRNAVVSNPGGVKFRWGMAMLGFWFIGVGAGIAETDIYPLACIGYGFCWAMWVARVEKGQT